ncbi:uncharacterized protein [Haliotis cracherodii]|uniref:uncharacterized protein n=1 Tax=Haliotis cracherodii TaxID=6455 RepID=UPI0039EAD80F
MNLKKTKVYKLIATGNKDAVIKGMYDYLKSGKSPNTRDSETGGGLLHHIVSHAERFTDPDVCVVLYMLACKDVDVDLQDNVGETALHKVVRKKGAFRIMQMLLRCGCDTQITNDKSQTALNILMDEKPDGWQETLHWYKKYHPGLWVLLQEPQPDRKQVERLLLMWSRLTTVKNGKIVNMKTLIQDDVRKTDLLQLIEKYENSIELALAFVGGLGFIVRMWHKQGILTNHDVNTRDHAYQRHYPECPEVPQPLLAVTWETNSLDAMEMIMDLKPNTSVLYNEYSDPSQAKPLFFHVLTSQFRPRDDKVIERLFQGSDLDARNMDGQTVLFEIIKYKETENIARSVLAAGVSISARDRFGRTARDYAQALNLPVYMKLIDEQVLRLIKNKQFDAVEKLILENYSFTGIKDSSGKSAAEYAKKHSSRQVFEVVKLVDAIQTYVRRVFTAVEDDAIDDLKKLLSCQKYANARDKCGRTSLLKAILLRQRDATLMLARDCSFIVNTPDNLGRYPLHYVYLFMDDPEVIDVLERQGADPDQCDLRGRRPVAYSRKMCSSQEYLNLQKEVQDFDMEVFIYETNFEEALKGAIKRADLDMVTRLVSGLKEHGEVKRFNSVLFDCVDQRREDIAIFLLRNGFQCDIYKQFKQCNPNDPMCAMMECSHSVTSLKQRAIDKQCSRVERAITDMMNGGLAPLVSVPPPFNYMPKRL